MAVFAVAGVLAVTVHTPLSSAAPNVQDGRFLQGGNLVVDYTCSGADAQTQTVLAGIGLATFPQQVTILSPAVEPSPSPGEDFQMTFNWSFLLSQSLVQTAVDLGQASLNISAATLPMSATTGATGSDVVGHPPATELVLGDGTQAVGYSTGPFTGTFTRTADVDNPIEFTPGTVLNTVVTSSGITLQITCAPEAGAVMTLNDETGVAPSTTTTTLPEVTTTEATPTTDSGVQGETAEPAELPRTGSSSLLLVVIALGLIDLGYLALTSSQPSRRRRPSTAR